VLHHPRLSRCAGALVLAFCVAEAAWAVDQTGPAAAVEASPAGASPASAPPAKMFGATAVDSSSLAENRGAADTVILNDIKAAGNVEHNVADHVKTGSNIITEGSFSGASGFSTVLQNSGNNVLIQNSTIVNVQVK
jgi:hypothetical protein